MTWTELHDAAEHQNSEGVITRARRHSDEAVLVDDHASTPLHTLCWGNPKVEAVQALIHAFPQAVTDQDILGDTPLHVAASYPKTSLEVVKVLLEACPTIISIANNEGLMPLHMACRHAPGNEEVIKLLLDVYPYAARSPVKMGEKASKKVKDLATRKEGDHVAVMDEAVRAATDLRYETLREEQKRDGAYPIHIAIAAGASLNVIKMLAMEEDDVLLMTNKFGETPLHVALSTRPHDGDVANWLLQKASSAAAMKDSRDGNLPLHVAAIHGCSISVARSLLETFHNAVYWKNSSSKTPWQLAAEAGKCSEEVMGMLKK